MIFGARMKKVTIRIIILFLLISGFHSVHIQAASNQETIDFCSTLNDQVAIVLVIDNSNSMIESDADSNRFNVAQMILELLSKDDYFAAVTFNNTADTLIPMSKLSDEQRQTTRDILSAPPAAGGTTDYQLALTQAEAEFAAVSDENLRRFIVFLTDGEPWLDDSSIDMETYLADLKVQVQAISEQNQGVPVYTIGFNTSNEELLRKISILTHGESFQGESLTLANDFFDIFRELKNRYDVLNLTNDGQISPFPVLVDEYTSRIIVMANDNNGVLNVEVTRSDGSLFEPAYVQNGIGVYHLLPNQDGSSAAYQIRGNLYGTIRAVRDTKTKLWLTAPKNNAVLPDDEEVIVRMNQDGISGDNTYLKIETTYQDTGIDLPVKVLQEGSLYNINLGFLAAGDYELTASLLLEDQIISLTSGKFTVSEDGKSGQVISPGIIDVTVPEEIWPSSSSRNFDIQITNRGTYLEQLNIKIDGVQINEEPLNSPAGETLNYQIPFKFTTGKPTVSLVIESFYDATIVRVSQDEIRVNNMSEPGASIGQTAAGTEIRDPDRDRADERQARWIQNALLFSAVVLAALLVGSIGLFIARHHLSKREIRIKLSGYLYYEHPDKKIGFISLSGFDPLKIRIGQEKTSDLHISADIPVEFDITIVPIRSDKNETLIELRCSPPGSLVIDGEIKTKTFLSYGDHFEMAGLEFLFSKEEPQKFSKSLKNEAMTEEGKDVLSGRI